MTSGDSCKTWNAESVRTGWWERVLRLTHEAAAGLPPFSGVKLWQPAIWVSETDATADEDSDAGAGAARWSFGIATPEQIREAYQRYGSLHERDQHDDSRPC